MGKNTSIWSGEKEMELLKALELGEQSGFVDDFDPEQNLSQLHRDHL